MKVTLDAKYRYKKIEFCCGEMGKLVMNQTVQSYPHSDHYPVFYVQTYRMDEKQRIYEHTIMKYCIFCGAKIEGNYVE